jgi:hypothetical protein
VGRNPGGILPLRVQVKKVRKQSEKTSKKEEDKQNSS